MEPDTEDTSVLVQIEEAKCVIRKLLLRVGSNTYWSQLVVEVWEGCWNHELCREGVQVVPPQYEEYRGYL